MKDERKVHRRRNYQDRAMCRGWIDWGWRPFRFARRWSDVDCLRCLKHRPKKREASDGK